MFERRPRLEGQPHVELSDPPSFSRKRKMEGFLYLWVTGSASQPQEGTSLDPIIEHYTENVQATDTLLRPPSFVGMW